MTVHMHLGCPKVEPDDFITDIKHDADCFECGDKWMKKYVGYDRATRTHKMEVAFPLKLSWGANARWCRKCDSGVHTWTRDDLGNKVPRSRATACHCGALRPAEERIAS